MTRLTIAALIAGMAAGAVEIAYLAKVRPLQADAGIQVAGVLLVCWALLTVMAFIHDGRKAWWALLPSPIALVGPGLMVGLFGACALNASACP